MRAGLAHGVSVILYSVRLGVLSRSRLQKYKLQGSSKALHAAGVALAFLSLLIVLLQLNGRIAAKAFDFVSGNLAPFELTGGSTLIQSAGMFLLTAYDNTAGALDSSLGYAGLCMLHALCRRMDLHALMLTW